MFSKFAILSLALLATTSFFKLKASSQTAKLTSDPALISQAVSAGRRDQLEELGFHDGYERGRTGLNQAPEQGMVRLGLTDPAEQKIYIDAYTQGYTQYVSSLQNKPTPTIAAARRTELQQQGYQDGYQRAKAGLDQTPQAGIDRLGLADPAEQKIYADAYTQGYTQYALNPSNRPTPTPTISAARQVQLRQQGYQDGADRARTSLNADPQQGIDHLGLTESTEQKIYSDAYARGYQEYSPNQSSQPASVISASRRAELQRQGYQDGAEQARAGLGQAPDQRIDDLGLTDLAEQRIYSTAYNRGYTESALNQPGTSGETATNALW